jgi:hypothetical protein
MLDLAGLARDRALAIASTTLGSPPSASTSRCAMARPSGFRSSMKPWMSGS